MIDECLQNAAEILDRERQTLEYVRNKAGTIGRLVDLANSAAEAYHKFEKRFGMAVYLKWQVADEGGPHDRLWIHVGGLIQLNENAIDNMSYSLGVSRAESGQPKQRMIRKYHFDYACPAIRAQRRSAAFHLQYPGRLLPEMKENCDDGHMDVWLEEPRIFALPMSLSLLLHMAFREFPDKYTDKLCGDGAWQSKFVHRDQTCLILPFLQKCVSISTEAKKKNLLWDIACRSE